MKGGESMVEMSVNELYERWNVICRNSKCDGSCKLSGICGEPLTGVNLRELAVIIQEETATAVTDSGINKK